MITFPQIGWNRYQMVSRARAEMIVCDQTSLGLGLPTLITGVLPVGSAAHWCTHTHGAGLENRRIPRGSRSELVAFAVHSAATFLESALCEPGVEIAAATRPTGMQVSPAGDLASGVSILPRSDARERRALESAHKACRVTVVMEHTDRQGNPRLVDACKLPVLVQGSVGRIITELGVLDVSGCGSLVLRELAPGVPIGYLLDVTNSYVDISAVVGPGMTDPPIALPQH